MKSTATYTGETNERFTNGVEYVFSIHNGGVIATDPDGAVTHGPVETFSADWTEPVYSEE